VVVVSRSLKLSSILSSRNDLYGNWHDLVGAEVKEVGYDMIPVANHSPSFAKCLINAPNFISLKHRVQSGVAPYRTGALDLLHHTSGFGVSPTSQTFSEG